jgi:hypothetical protein
MGPTKRDAPAEERCEPIGQEVDFGRAQISPTGLAQMAIGELGRSGAAVARYLEVAPSTANRVVTGVLHPLAQRLFTAIQGR